MRLLRFLLIFAALFVGLAAAAAWLVPPRLHLDQYRDRIAAVASERLGREVRISGPIAFRLLPEPMFTASGVSFAAAAAGVSVTAAQLRLRIALMPLLEGRVDAKELVLRGADLRLPWPLHHGAFRLRAPRWLAAFSARVEDGTLHLGHIAVTGIDATLITDAYTGSYSAAGTAHFANAGWHFTAKLSQPAEDGSATLDVTLDGTGRVQGVGGRLSGQFAADGSFAGHLVAQGPNLAQLLPAPAETFSAEGRITVAEGLAAADDLALRLGGSPARGAVALRITPTTRLDIALAASRLDLDAWLPVLARPAQVLLPTGIDLSAEAATVAGGTLRRVRAAIDLQPGGAEVREARAVLPGDAPVRLTGRLLPGTAARPGPRFVGNATLSAPALRTTLAWMAKAGFSPLAALPEGVLHRASLTAHLIADRGAVAVSQIAGTVDGSHVTGSLSVHGGKRFAIGAGLTVDRLELDPWLPAHPIVLTELPARIGVFDFNLRLEAKQAVLHGITFAPLLLDAGAEGGRLVVRKLDVAMNGAHASGSVTVTEQAHVTDGRLDIEASHAAALQTLLPDRLADLANRAPGLWRAAAAVQVLGAGSPDHLRLKISADLADLQLEAQPIIDAATGRWTAGLTLRHPGAPRLLQALGLSKAPSWLGEGSLGLIAKLSGGDGRIAADSFDLSAGALHATGALQVAEDGALHLVTGHVDADTLPLPLPTAHSTDPLPLAALAGWDASVRVTAGRVLENQAPALTHAAARFGLAHGVLRIDGLTATLAGGVLGGSASLDTTAEPPVATLRASLTGATVGGPVFDLPLDVAGGTLDLGADLRASGHAPATLLATLDGRITVAARSGTLSGIALGALDANLTDDAVRKALAGGSTEFDALTAAATVAHGLLTLQAARLEAPGGTATLGGTIDLPDRALDLHLHVRPARPNPPRIGLRITGTPAAPQRSPELADLTRWRATQPTAAAAP